MITASHNPEADNGVKLSDPDGGMLSAEWEGHAVDLANADSEDDAVSLIRKLFMDFSQTSGPFGSEAGTTPRRMVVHVGRDTRRHSPHLASLTIRGARSLGATVIDHGIVTTPQLHHFVMHSNAHRLPNVVPQRADEDGYLDTICGSYAALMRTASSAGEVGGGSLTSSGGGRRTVAVDCACGVGGTKVPLVMARLRRLRVPGLANFVPHNLPGDGPLNGGCGAEFVQKGRRIPAVYDRSDGTPVPAGVAYHASLDGDADRIVFHYSNRGGEFRLLDGDKIATLVTEFVREELEILNEIGLGSAVRCGVVQTAYANGSSTSYLRDVVKADIAVARTGVKFVHAIAHDSFDVGVYFEANGHGTILFGPRFYAMLSDAESVLRGRSGRNDRSNVAWQRLRALPGLVNQAIGDALSDLLLVDAVLFIKGWTIEDWDGLYQDMPSRQCKVRVRDSESNSVVQSSFLICSQKPNLSSSHVSLMILLHI